MSDCYTLLAKGLLAHSLWFGITEFIWFLILFLLSGAGKWLQRGSGQISVKRDSIFELSVLIQI